MVKLNATDVFIFLIVSLASWFQGCYLVMMVGQATEKSYVQSPWQSISTSNFFIPLLQIKDILSFPGRSEGGLQWRQLSLYVMLLSEEAALPF